jgi:vitamin B12 transporter
MRRIVLGIVMTAAGSGPTVGQAQQRDSTARDSVRLEEIVVTGSRVGEVGRVRTRAADQLSSGELARRQLWRLADALELLPGSGLVGGGGTGGVTSAFFRGTNSNHTLILLDGIRINDANAIPSSFLGGFDFAPTDRLEVVRGPAGALYGGSAIGGVIAVDGSPPPSRTRWGAGAEAGSFATYRGTLHGEGRSSRLGWSASGSLIDTDNQRPDNQFDQRTQQLRIEFSPTPKLTIGSTFRGLQSSYTSPGDIRTTNTTPVGESQFENNLGTAFLDARMRPQWTTRLVAGIQGYYIRGSSRFNGCPAFISTLKSTRKVVDWQNNLRIARGVSGVVGANLEWTDVRDNDGPKDERLSAGYAQLTIAPGSRGTLTGGLRVDDYTSFDRAVTGQLAGSYFVGPSGTKIRASVGSGFLPPGLADRYGSAFQEPNPGLEPERSKGFDVGVDQFFASGRGVVSGTVFANWLEDLIGFEPSPDPQGLGRSVNLGKARTRGLELSSRVEAGRFDFRAGYTFLSTENRSEPDPTQRRLIRRPRHSAGADLSFAATGRLVLGAGLVAQLDREDTDFNQFPFQRVDPGNYLDGRVHAAWRARSGVLVKLRLENLFDRRYEDAWGFPTLGRRITVGLGFDR